MPNLNCILALDICTSQSMQYLHASIRVLQIALRGTRVIWGGERGEKYAGEIFVPGLRLLWWIILITRPFSDTRENIPEILNIDKSILDETKLQRKMQLLWQLSLHKKWSFPLRISSVSVTKSAVSCGFGHIWWRNALWKTSFFVQCTWKMQQCKNAKMQPFGVKEIKVWWRGTLLG